MPAKAVGAKARKWSFSEESSLVDLYRNRPQLWDPSTPGYKKKHIRAQLFSEICDQLRIDPALVQDKLRKMRIYFFQLYKKDCGLTKRTESAAEEHHAITWPFYNSLMFLQEARKRRLSNGQIDSEEDDAEHLKGREEREEPSSESGTSELFSPNSPSEGHQDLGDSYVREDQIEERGPQSPLKIFEEVKSDDEEDLFGKLVAKRLKRITDLHQRDETKRQIMEFLYSPQQ